jgi:hypothetical protein
MASEAEIAANRANAPKSTGPRTPEGKEKASQDALQPGLFAREGVCLLSASGCFSRAGRRNDEYTHGRGTPSFHPSIIPGFPCRPGPGGPIVQNEPCAKQSWRHSAGVKPARPKDSRPAGIEVGVSGGNERCEALRIAKGQPQRK